MTDEVKEDVKATIGCLIIAIVILAAMWMAHT